MLPCGPGRGYRAAQGCHPTETALSRHPPGVGPSVQSTWRSPARSPDQSCRGDRPSIQSWMSRSRHPTARVYSPPRRMDEGNDPSRSRRQIVVLLNPVISMTSAILTTRSLPRYHIGHRRSVPGRLSWVWFRIRIFFLPPRCRQVLSWPPCMASPIRSETIGDVLISTYRRGSTTRSRICPQRSRSTASGRASTSEHSRSSWIRAQTHSRGISKTRASY